MEKRLVISPQDPFLNSKKFRMYRSVVERNVEAFVPRSNEKQTMEIQTPWGEVLTVRAGDFIVSEIVRPYDRWPVRADIFEETYIITRPGFCIKRAVTPLIKLTELTDGDENVSVTVQSLEGETTVRSGDFYLARGPMGEIWAVPREKVENVMVPVDDQPSNPK